MLALVLAAALNGFSSAAPPAEVQRALTTFEVTERADGGGDWTRVTIGAPAGAKAWRRALAAPIESGRWLLSVGGPGLDLVARVNGRELERLPDPFAGNARLRAGPRFDVPADALKEGENRLEVEFRGDLGGAGLEDGPVF